MARELTERARIARELRRDLREKDRATLARLRAAIDAARKQRTERTREITRTCKSARESAREWAKRARIELRERIERERAELRGSCSARRTRASEEGASAIEAARAELAQARADLSVERAWTRKQAKRPTAQRAARVMSESEEEVLRNIPPDLVPVWHAVKKGIHATARRSRTEAFLEWAHDHPGRVYELLERDAVRHLEALERDERALAREMERGSRYQGTAAHVASRSADFDPLDWGG